MSIFQPTKSLLYPQFESYKLKPLDPEENILEYELPGQGATQSRFSNYSSSFSNHLNFKEVKNRIGWDHLYMNYKTKKGIYIDKEWNVIGFSINDDLVPTFNQLISLPIPISSTNQQSEFPSALSLTLNKWAISSGHGTLYILEISSNSSIKDQGKFIAKYEFDYPFLLRSQHIISENEIKLLITRSINDKENQKNKTNTFELIEISINPNELNQIDNNNNEIPKVNWKLKGGDLPIYTSWINNGWLILSPEEFNENSISNSEKELDSTVKGEETEQVKGNSKLGLGASTIRDQKDSNDKIDIDRERSYPYSWTQDSDSINIKLPLPKGYKRENIKLNLTSTTFTISISSKEETNLSAELSEFLKKPVKTFWTNIDPSLSTWTLSNDQIEIDIAKIDHNIRWPSVFSPSNEDDDDDEDEEEEVPETLSKEFLASVRESFNNIKSREQEEEDDEPNVNFQHPTIPALLREEMDFDEEEEDDNNNNNLGEFNNGQSNKIGKEVFIGFINFNEKNGNDISTINWSKNTINILSLPLSQQSYDKEEEEEEEFGIIIKSAFDGLLFSPPFSATKTNDSNLIKKQWKHISTNPALSFVLSSKKDLRLIKHLNLNNNNKTIVFAFDSGTSSIGQGNIYIYYNPEKNEKFYSKQSILPISGGEKGALLGINSIKINEKQIILALTEKYLIILKDIL
ncbi:uncharacterized protein I206_104321 [Kwoniella pini CBS 10737]|uniref:NudC domain-containing protein 1 n=1 Tax=Kwoniella pini CBS 10737 TaxID=1296096 RepID=A0A1B9I215_9TREE|nr:uncharacterized protein I206_04101 [Kwoniella pini CBS 10737]OCF49579.1 hypothetical protein I206_04101 [Kwoniella pini CBS 10737]